MGDVAGAGDRKRGAVRPPRTVVIYSIPGHHRSQVTCEAMLAGIRACGDTATIVSESTYNGIPIGDTAVFYGLEGNTPRIFQDYRRDHPRRAAVYIDLGYWGRREGGRWTGFHKVVVNHRHPVDYFRARAMPHDRFERFMVGVKPWRVGSGSQPILLAGMGAKGAAAEGFGPDEWEQSIAAEIRKHTNRPIIYRPKPSWKERRPIPGCAYSDPVKRTVEQELRDCWAVVSHHGNVAVEALLAGVPAFCWGGVARDLSLQRLEDIEKPMLATDREQWAADIAYTQWSVAEMAQGLAWRHLKSEGLLP